MGALKWLLGTTLALKIADVTSTYYLVNRHGAHLESNPFMYDMIQAYGLGWTCLISMLIYSALMFILYKYERRNLLMIATAFMSLVVLINLAHVIMLG
jgi:uncharacterized protein DUF5658